MRPRSQSVFANPVLVGATTVLFVLIGVLLAYNANQGLPFVPTRELKVDIGDGSNLVAGNDVREGGFRIGLVSALHPVELPGGVVGAQLTLKLNTSNGKVPVDSRVSIVPRSVLGLKYVDLEKGTSSQIIPDGGTLPITQTNVPVQVDDLLNTFDVKTRSAIQLGLLESGNLLAARGSSVNDTISNLPPLLTHLEPVAKLLSDPRTGLSRLLSALDNFMGTVAPVAQINARLFGELATTFEAISRDPNALEATIRESPPTLAVSTDSLAAQQPLLSDLTTFGQFMAPATAELRVALPLINPAIEAGTTTLRRTPILNANLEQVFEALKSLAQAPGTNVALNALAATTGVLNPMIRYLGPYQTVCDYWNYWWTYLAEQFGAQTNYGFAQRALINTATLTGNGVGAAGAVAPANGEGNDATPLPFGGVEFLHAQAYGAAVDNQGNADCETGQRGYPLKLNQFDPEHRNLVLDPHTPGDQGPTFHGRARVPAGETFSRNPSIGPQLPKDPANP